MAMINIIMIIQTNISTPATTTPGNNNISSINNMMNKIDILYSYNTNTKKIDFNIN